LLFITYPRNLRFDVRSNEGGRRVRELKERSREIKVAKYDPYG